MNRQSTPSRENDDGGDDDDSEKKVAPYCLFCQDWWKHVQSRKGGTNFRLPGEIHSCFVDQNKYYDVN